MPIPTFFDVTKGRGNFFSNALESFTGGQEAFANQEKLNALRDVRQEKKKLAEVMSGEDWQNPNLNKMMAVAPNVTMKYVQTLSTLNQQQRLMATEKAKEVMNMFDAGLGRLRNEPGYRQEFVNQLTEKGADPILVGAIPKFDGDLATFQNAIDFARHPIQAMAQVNNQLNNQTKVGIAEFNAAERRKNLAYQRGTTIIGHQLTQQGKTTIKEMDDPDIPGQTSLFLLDNQGNPLKKVGTKGAGEKDFTDEGKELMARNFLLSGQIPGLGLGKKATQARMDIINKAGEIAGQEGITPTDIQTTKTVYASLKTGLGAIERQRGPMLAFAKTAEQNLDLAESLSGNVGRTGVPVLNRWLLAGRKSLAGDQEVAKFDASIRVAANEFAKVTSSATGGGVTSDQARKEIDQILNSAQTPEQFKGVAATLRLDMKNRISGYEDSIKRAREGLKAVGEAGGGGPAKATVPKPGTGLPDQMQTPYGLGKKLNKTDAMGHQLYELSDGRAIPFLGK